jgi:hypothetical protein
VSFADAPEFQSGTGRPRAFESRGGFALLITITLLAFLVLLLVSLATLTRVETQVATNSAQLAQARANAMFALNLAMGKIQEYAGPDQRVTARADIQPANTQNPFWTGVWDARPVSATNPTHATAPATTAPMVWLVSGNETNGTQITPATTAVVDPAAGNDNVWLVRNVFGRDLSAQLPYYPLDGRVKLAKTPIEVPANQLPGFGSTATTATKVGAYAWWVGDEGIKAKINMADPYRAAAATDPEAAWRRSAAPRPGLELLADGVLAGTFTGTTDALEVKRATLLSYEQFPMLETGLATMPGLGQAGRAFHDLTVAGAGVLADTLRGGLRRDLTRGLAGMPASGTVAEAEIGNDAAVFTLPTPGPYGRTMKGFGVWTPNMEPHAPTWSEVRAWWSIRAPADNSGMDPVGAALVDTTRNGITCPATSGHAILPVVTLLELGYGLDVGPDLRYRIMIRPRLVLMNPYNVPLKTAAYSVVYQSSVTSDSELSFTVSKAGVTAPTMTYSLSTGTGLVNPNPVNGLRQLSFNITDGFGPGEIRVYSLPVSATADIQVNDGVFELEPGIGTNRAYLATGDTIPATVYDPAHRELTTVSWSKIPADHPRISIALGATTTGAVAAPSVIDRYIQTSSSLLYGLNGGPYGGGNKPNPSAKLDTDAARQLRTIRYTLRHADLTMMSMGGSQPSENDIPGGGGKTDMTSGSRFLIDNNPRAIISQRIAGWNNTANYGVTTSKGAGYSDIDYDEAPDGTILGYWGGSTLASSGSTSAMLFDVLRQNEEVVSLGRLGHVNWGVDGKHPAYPLGNSFASIFYPSDKPDFGYALNEALWDRFFLSTLPSSLAVRPANLPDSRLVIYDPAGAPAGLTGLEGMDGYQLAATRLMVDGSFNVNSTSVEAWAAFLGSVQPADYAYQGRAGARTDTAVRAFPRVQNRHDPDPAASGQSGNMYEWSGYRKLDAGQLRQLAVRIVAGIQARGRPARSLAEFMNRDLSQAATSERNQEGIVQAAINMVVNTDTPDGSGNGTGLGALQGLNTTKVVPAASASPTFTEGDNPDAARGKLRSTGAPGFLMQSDLLTPLAPSMSARSDTFRVRTYGESVNPVTGEIGGRAWCEAVVQRVPEYVDQADANLSALGNATSPAATNTTNQTFGRKFVIVQFRWLTSEEI